MPKPPKTPRPQKPPILPVQPDHNPDPTISLTQEKLIGRTIVEWARLEGCMGDAIKVLADLEFEVARIFTARMDATALLKTLRDLGSLKLAEANYHALSVICDKIDIRREDRNLITHGTWGREAGQIQGYALSLRIKGNPSEVVSETFSYTRMKDIIADIRSLKWDLIRLLKLHEQLGTPPGQPPSE